MRLPSLLLLAAFVVPACAATEDSPADDDWDETTASTSESGLAAPGAWKPLPEVLASGETQLVRYDDAPAWSGAAGCGGALLAGTRELGEYILDHFDGATSYGGYSCRQNTANAAKTSVHGTGRAIDVFVPLDGGQADNGKGDPIANWLVENAERIGVQYFIWDRAQWNVSVSEQKLSAYLGPHPHHDHLHIELNSDGAARQTPFFRR